MVHPFLVSLVSRFVRVHQDEVRALLHAFSAFFFLLGAYFVVLPLRDEAALSLGTGVLPALFLASLVLTMLAAPASSYLLSLPNLPKSKALVILYRFFGGSLLVFFLLYIAVPASHLPTDERLSDALKPEDDISIVNGNPITPTSWHELSWLFIGVRGSFFLWIALLNLFTISAMWARITDVMTSEVGFY
jgi:AAA family ATP:ADP antiporter